MYFLDASDTSESVKVELDGTVYRLPIFPHDETEERMSDLSGIDIRGMGAATVTDVVNLTVPQSHRSFWRRLWFLVSCIPRYLVTGSVEVP